MFANYYERADGLAVLRPDMAPHVMHALGIDPARALAKDEINALIAGRRADGEKIVGRHYAVSRGLPVNPKDGAKRHSTPIGAIDFPVTPHKSVSVGYAFGNPAERAAIFTAHIEAARLAVGEITAERGTIRLGKGGMSGTMAADTGWIEFTHRTARKIAGDDLTPGDPDIHTHFVAFAATVERGGKVGSFDTGHMQGTTFAADSLYHAALAQNLRDAGFDAVQDPETGAARLTAIPDEVCKLFSKRMNRGEELARQYTAERGEKWTDLTPAQRTERIKSATQSKDQRRGAKADDVANFGDWARQAKKRCNWEAGPSLKSEAEPAPELTREQCIRLAYEAALPYLADRFAHRSVIQDWELRVAAGRGLVASRFSEPADVGRVVDLMRAEGVDQHGQRTKLIFAQEEGRRHASVTTERHETDEREFVRLVEAAAKDRSGIVPADLLERKIVESGLDFSGKHGEAQRAGIVTLGRGGRFGMLVAASGAGKTTALQPLVAAWAAEGRDVVGTSLAWRQADDLVDAGIGRDRVKAFSVLLNELAGGTLKLSKRSVVVVDEASQLGTQQGLALLREREKRGFSIVAIGDDLQTGAVEAGNFIRLAERGMGGSAPRIETTRRQQTERERTIAALFREGRGAEGLKLKISDGTALMVGGSRNDVIDRVAQVYVDHLKATGTAPTISTPTNQDAHDISAAVRLERRALGLVGPDLRTEMATDGTRGYALPLAKGDHVRLYANTRAAGTGRGGSIGRNGSVLEVVDLSKAGMTVRTAKGRVALVHWSDLTDKASGRRLLGYGTTLTVHSGQGVSSDAHVYALPSGSQGVDGQSLYSGNTRHRLVSYLVTSGDAEMRSVRGSRPVNDPHPITTDDKWANVAMAFSRQPEKDTALALFGRVGSVRRGGVHGFQATSSEASAFGPKPPRTPSQQEPLAAEIQKQELLAGPDEARRERRSMRAAAERPKRPAPRPEALQAEALAAFGEALRQCGLRLRGQPAMDGRWHRTQVEGDKGHKMSGRYRGYLDGRPAGFIENFKAGQAGAWRMDGAAPKATADQRRRMQEDQVAREAGRREAEGRAARRANAAWANGRPVAGHDYLARKGVRAHGLRQDAKGNLIVPMRDAGGDVRNVQTIAPDGEKRFVKGGRKAGLYAQLGAIDPMRPLLVAKGYATAATLHEATGMPVVIAFDAGNLRPVAEVIRARHPGLPMVFAADNDHHLPRRDNPLPNVGKEKAQAAAAAVGGTVLPPGFGDIERQTVAPGESPPTDWNDFAALHGRERLKDAIRQELKGKGITMPTDEQSTRDRPRPTQAQRDALRATLAAQSPRDPGAAQRRQEAQRQEAQRSQDREMER